MNTKGVAYRSPPFFIEQNVQLWYNMITFDYCLTIII